jgi:threonine-phosphate decarboxylase
MTDPFRISPPVHGGQLRQIAARYGAQAEALLDFSANINPAGPPRSVLMAMQQALMNPATLSTYPDLELADLKHAIAENAGVRPENVAVANGFVPLLDAVLRSLHIRRCLLPVPCFSEYRRALENASVAITPYLLASNRDFLYDIDAMLETLIEDGCDAILLANPQNPSGALFSEPERMLQFVKAANEHSITVLLDEAFVDYSPNHSLVSHSIQQPNLIVFRSVTKFFAIPGLRVAYTICNSATARVLQRMITPWPITSLASDAVCAALRDEVYAADSRLANERQRSWLEKELLRLKIATYPSSTNFLLLRLPEAINSDLLWERMLVEQHVVMRSCANFEGLEDGHLRIAVRSQPENQKLIHSLESVLAAW